MPIDPQQIPFAPPQVAPPPNALGPQATIGMQQRQMQFERANQIPDALKQGLQDYLRYQENQQGQQALNQLGPLRQAQTSGQQADTYSKLAPSMTDQQQQDNLNRLLGGGPGSGTISGTSPAAPPPGDQSQGGVSPSSGSLFGASGVGGGIGRQSPIGVQSSGTSSVTGQPMSMAGTQQDPYAHMHMDPANPYTLAGSPQSMQGPGMNRQISQQAGSLSPQPSDSSSDVWQKIQQVTADPSMPPIQRARLLSILNAQYRDLQDQGEASALSKMTHIQSLFKTPPTADDILPMVRAAGPGVLAGKALDLAGTQNKLNMDLTKFTTTEQNKAKSDAGKLYDDYAGSTADAQAAKSALAQAQQNPAVFNEALLNVGKVLGVTSRNPKFALEAVSAGDPSIGGQIQEYLSKKGGGRVSPQLLSGLNNLVDQTLQSKQGAFESKANAHAQRNAAMFGNDVNQAKQALFPQYQWGAKNAAGTGQYTPDVVAYAQKYGISPDTAQQIKQQRGGQ